MPSPRRQEQYKQFPPFVTGERILPIQCRKFFEYLIFIEQPLIVPALDRVAKIAGMERWAPNDHPTSPISIAIPKGA